MRGALRAGEVLALADCDGLHSRGFSYLQPRAAAKFLSPE